MKIAFVSTILGYPWGGADVLWTCTAAEALSSTHVVFVAVTPLVAAHHRMAALRQAGALLHERSSHTSHRGKLSRWRQKLLRSIHHPDSLLASLDRFRPDYVLVNQGGTYDFLLEDGLTEWLLATQTRFALISQSNSETDTLTPVARISASVLTERAHRLVFVSHHNRLLAEQQLGRKLENAVIVPNPVQLPFPTPLAWPDDTQVAKFAVVARLEMRDKGLDVLVHSLAATLGHEPDWRLDIYGRGPDGPALQALARQCCVADRIHFQGFNDDLGSIWRDHHMLFLPSRREGCALAMLEAMRCGRPVLATLVGGVSDWIIPGVNGFIAQECNVAALSQAIHAAWMQRSAWSQLGAASHQISLGLDPNPGRTLLSFAASPDAIVDH